ncbi:hypothetical protein TUN199_06625 [Pyrenophora tritici-repentis]|nr:Flavoprotein monooxygenase [Pyrenophora tritici-repentis]KAI0609172.1 Flavoprotein monooxygenase [Pyrenophora tritici-repentis]KAI0621375.1 hypothetical protein TUN199_06625 [Pyrenophora tritici-repentis]
MTSTKPLNILISGSGICGPSCAYWLHCFLPMAQITIIERSPVPRLGGQAVDLRSACIPIVKKMGLLDKVLEKNTTEMGMEFVYLDTKRKALFPKTGEEERQSATSEYEILRGDIAEIFFNATKSLRNVTYIFDEMITSITQVDTPGSSTTAEVTFKNSHLPPSTYDLVIGADGQMSRTRRLVFGHGPKNDDYLHRLGQYSALFTMLRDPIDNEYAQWYNAPGGRLFLLRPDPYGTQRAYLSVTDKNLSRFDEIDGLLRTGTREQQQAWFEREFQGAGYQTDRCLAAMKKADDFYMQQIAQVRMPQWSKGCCVVVGDAAYCPSPISGVGTAAAIVGSYVLAGEVAKSLHDIPAALREYERVTRGFVDKAQKLVPGAPQIANPQSVWGIKVLNAVTGVLASRFVQGLSGLVGRLFPAFGSTTAWCPPDYEGVKGV